MGSYDKRKLCPLIGAGEGGITVFDIIIATNLKKGQSTEWMQAQINDRPNNLVFLYFLNLPFSLQARFLGNCEHSNWFPLHDETLWQLQIIWSG